MVASVVMGQLNRQLVQLPNSPLVLLPVLQEDIRIMEDLTPSLVSLLALLPLPKNILINEVHMTTVHVEEDTMRETAIEIITDTVTEIMSVMERVNVGIMKTSNAMMIEREIGNAVRNEGDINFADRWENGALCLQLNGR